MLSVDEALAKSGLESGPEYWNFEAAAKRFRELIRQKSKPPTLPIKQKRKTEIFAVFSDFHAPHYNEEFFAEAVVDAKRRGATRAVVPGDLGDQFGFSRFMKYDHVPIRDEMAAMTNILTALSGEFESVDVIQGNHDERAKKYFAKVVESEFFFLVKWNILELAANGLRNVRLPCLMADGRPVPFLWRSGDLVLGHPETCSKVGMRAVDTFANWLVQWRSILNFPEIRVVGQGHTHQAGGPMIRPDGIAVFELGCMCRLPDYVFDPKLRYRPQTNCYGLFVQRNGHTDLNESRLFFPTKN